MSNKALTYAFEAEIDKPAAKFVLVALADHATDHAGEDWSCFPAVERLMQFTAQSRSTVERNLAWLVAEGWISRVRRKMKGGRLGVYDYVIHRQKRAPEEVVEGVESDPDHTSECRMDHASNGGATMRQIDGQPHVTLPHVLTPIEPSVEPSLSAGASLGGIDWAAEIWAAWPTAGQRASSPRLLRDAVAEEIARGADPAALVLAAAAYGGDRSQWGASGIPVTPHRFFAEGRWETFVPAVGAPRGSARARTAFACERFRRVVLAAKGPTWVASWLDPCSWDAETRTIDPRSTTRGDRLRTEIGDLLRSEGVKLEGRG